MIQSLSFPRTLVIALALALSAPLPAANLRLPRIFTDNMVLQQELLVAVWGWADAGEKIAVSLNDKTATATADEKGRWMLRLPAMKADGGKHALTIKGADSQIALANVVLGEVWLCAGQSNMNRRQEIKESHPDIRLFWIAGSTIPLADDLGEEVAGWSESTPEGLAVAKPELVREKRAPRKDFTEVGYVFGRRIHENRKLKYVKATAHIIDDNTVEISSPEITAPKFVRFGWHSLARYNLVNSDNLPAISFKTDPQDHHRR